MRRPDELRKKNSVFVALSWSLFNRSHSATLSMQNGTLLQVHGLCCKVKIKGVLQKGGGSWRAKASLENLFRSTPQAPPGIKISTLIDPLGKHTETFKITNKIAFVMISKSAKSLQTH